MAARLGLDAAHRQRVSASLKERVQRVWERQEVVMRWGLFFMTAVGYAHPPPSLLRAALSCHLSVRVSHRLPWLVAPSLRRYPASVRQELRETLYSTDAAERRAHGDLLPVDLNLLHDSGGLVAADLRRYAATRVARGLSRLAASLPPRTLVVTFLHRVCGAVTARQPRTC